MKRFLTLCLLLLTTRLHGATGLSVINVGTLQLATNAATTYLIKQGFEGTGYDNGETWTEAHNQATSPNPDYTAVPLEGSQSLRIIGSDGIISTYTSFTVQDEVWGYCLLKATGSFSGGDCIRINDSSGTFQMLVAVNADGTLGVYDSAVSGASTVDTLSSGTTFSIWFHYKKGTGANSIHEAGFSTDTTKPTAGNKFVSKTNGASTTQAGRLMLRVSEANADHVYDHVRVNNSNIGSAPD